MNNNVPKISVRKLAFGHQSGPEKRFVFSLRACLRGAASAKAGLAPLREARNWDVI
jgi:hypothetical protein